MSKMSGAVVGAILGVPISYYLQASWIQEKITLGKYITKLPEIIQNSELLPTLVVSMVVCGIIGIVVVTFMSRESKITLVQKESVPEVKQSKASEIAEFKKLHDDGVLSDEEFEKEKAKILNN
ncbi:MAG: SHOCT domain-containing protein [Campylobacterota bacterium]|nr:SHOCT domain-containing protein [Campylobacterota bacterium]